jgi:hypothetical protein
MPRLPNMPRLRPRRSPSPRKSNGEHRFPVNEAHGPLWASLRCERRLTRYRNFRCLKGLLPA